MLFLLILLPETLPDALRKPLVWSDLNPFRQYWACLKVVFRYPLLICELTEGPLVLAFAKLRRHENPCDKIHMRIYGPWSELVLPQVSFHASSSASLLYRVSCR